jgi:hypothetical protein
MDLFTVIYMNIITEVPMRAIPTVPEIIMATIIVIQTYCGGQNSSEDHAGADGRQAWSSFSHLSYKSKWIRSAGLLTYIYLTT